jgi:hypothetical protein
MHIVERPAVSTPGGCGSSAVSPDDTYDDIETFLVSANDDDDEQHQQHSGGGGGFKIFGDGEAAAAKDQVGLGNQLGAVWLRSSVVAVAMYVGLLCVFGYFGGPTRPMWRSLEEKQWQQQQQQVDHHEGVLSPLQYQYNCEEGLQQQCQHHQHQHQHQQRQQQQQELDDRFAWAPGAVGVAFVASGCRSLVSLAFFADSKQRPALLSSLVVNAIAAHAHRVLHQSPPLASWKRQQQLQHVHSSSSEEELGCCGHPEQDQPLLDFNTYGSGGLPVWTNCFGRRMSAARWAEWVPTVFFLMV